MLFDFRIDMDKIKESMCDTSMGLPSGLQALDNAILGFDPGEMIIIAGRPGMGKSSLARDIMLSVGSPDGAGGTVILFTLEMLYQEVAESIAATFAKVDYYKNKREGTMDSIKAQLDEACAHLSSYNMIVDDNSYLTPDFIKERLKEVSQKETTACVIVDYLQLMSLRKTVENRQAEVAEISRELKAIAKDYDLPVIALSQLNRNVEYRESARPRMSDLRESGAMEQDASKVILIHRPSYNNMSIDPDAEDTGEAELIVVKNKRGPRGIVNCAFIKEWTSFCDIPKDEF